MTPVPIVAGSDILRRYDAGTVGLPPQAIADCRTPEVIISLGSSGMKSSGAVGVVPIAAGRPRPTTLAVALTRKKPISNNLALPGVAPVRISQDGFAIVTLEVLIPSE